MRPMLRTFLFATLSVIFFSSCQNEAAELINAASHSTPVANAGPSRSITLPTNTVTLNGSGSSANGPITGYLWSMVSGPNTATIQTPGSATTVISNLVQGNYVFQLMVIDSAGYTGLDSASVQVAGVPAPVPVTLTLQPVNNTQEYLFSGGPAINQSGHAFEVAAGAWTNGGNIFNERGVLRFDFTSIPVGATIVSAKLSLYSTLTPNGGDQINANSGTNNAFFIKRISTPWSTTGATWANQPPTTTVNQVSVPHTNLPFLDIIDLDIKNLVVDLQASGNYGMMMILQNEVAYNIRQFYSSYSPTAGATKYPKLVIVYQ